VHRHTADIGNIYIYKWLLRYSIFFKLLSNFGYSFQIFHAVEFVALTTGTVIFGATIGITATIVDGINGTETVDN